jgi:hypothetical protein
MAAIGHGIYGIIGTNGISFDGKIKYSVFSRLFSEYSVFYFFYVR